MKYQPISLCSLCFKLLKKKKMISAPQQNILMTLKNYGKGGDMCGYGFGVVCFFLF